MSYWDTDRQEWVRGTPPAAAPGRPFGTKEADGTTSRKSPERAKWSHATLLTTVVATVLTVAVVGFGGWSLLHHGDAEPDWPVSPSAGTETAYPTSYPTAYPTAYPTSYPSAMPSPGIEPGGISGGASGASADPCSAPGASVSAQWQLGTGTPETGTGMRACRWQSPYGTFTLVYSSGALSISGTPTPIPVSGAPSAEAAPNEAGNGCLVKWPTSFGQLTLGAYQADATEDMCRLAAAFGSALAPGLPG
ncbi:hypothetical protein ACIBK8_22030 [Streptomyces sp. NPDC050161]|uniref:hypothetical protein n=1 Tax=Streptomyces sp. NPDC050161 TaxID=3365604 RepID=UPI00379D576B